MPQFWNSGSYPIGLPVPIPRALVALLKARSVPGWGGLETCPSDFIQPLFNQLFTGTIEGILLPGENREMSTVVYI